MDRTLGYYTCNGIEFESKIHALQYSTIANQPVNWHFNTLEFDSYRWDIEPVETLEQLYQKRARQIREQYDYVVVSYSGGSDSWNLMKAFMDQNLFVDEVVSNWALDASKNFIVLDSQQHESWNNIAEYKLNCVDRLKEIQAQCPGTKITINDTSQAIVDAFITAGDASWTKNKREVLNPNGTTNYNYKYFSEIRKRFDRNKKIAIVVGQDKPKLRIENNNLYLYFVDKTVNLTSVQEHLDDYPNCHSLLFYWSPDCCDLLAKQAHTVMKFIHTDPKWVKLFSTKYVKVQRLLQENVLKSWLYPGWNSNWFQVNKSLGDWDSNLDYWFTRGWAGTKEHAIWSAGIDHVVSSVDSKYISRNENGTVAGTVPFESPKYFIGTIKISPP